MDPLRRLLLDETSLILMKANEMFRLLDREVPCTAVTVFLYIAAHDNCHKQALEEDLDMSTASASRTIDMLCDKNRLSKPGYGLVEKRPDPANGRRLIVSLTPKGKAFLKQYKESIYG